MSQATTNFHRTVKKPGAIIFTALVAFFGFAVFPIGIVLFLVLSYLNSNFFHLDNAAPIMVVIALGVLAALYTVIEDISKMLDAHKTVIQELIQNDQALIESNEEIWDELKKTTS